MKLKEIITHRINEWCNKIGCKDCLYNNTVRCVAELQIKDLEKGVNK